MSWSVVANRFTWGTVVYGGAAIGTVGFDPDLGAVMTITNMQQQQLNYTVVAVGVTMQRIYYRGLGAPTVVTGGTAVTAGGVTTVTTIGNSNVGLGWAAPPPSGGSGQLYDNMIMYLGLAALVPMIAAIGYILSLMQGGDINPSQIAGGVLILLTTFAIIAVLYNALR